MLDLKEILIRRQEVLKRTKALEPEFEAAKDREFQQHILRDGRGYWTEVSLKNANQLPKRVTQLEEQIAEVEQGMRDIEELEQRAVMLDLEADRMHLIDDAPAADIAAKRREASRARRQAKEIARILNSKEKEWRNRIGSEPKTPSDDRHRRDFGW